MKKILVPTDFSANANNACKLARNLAARTNAEIHLLHVVYTPADWALMTDVLRSKYPESQEKIRLAEHNMAQLAADPMFVGVDVKTTLSFGATIDEINRYLRQQAVDLIIVGSHGAANKSDLFIGSNTQKVMRNSKVPVIAVKDTYTLSDLDRMVFASNFEPNTLEPFQQMLAICQAFSAQLDLLYINTPANFKDTDEIESLLHQFIESAKIKGDVKIVIRNDRDVAQGIVKHCRKHQIQMAALVTHRKAKAAHYLMGVTETLVFHADFPIISINVSE